MRGFASNKFALSFIDNYKKDSFVKMLMDRGEQRKKRKDKRKDRKRFPYRRGGKFRTLKLGVGSS